ncbi:MAG: hypothetical protein HKN15_07720, partial [Xanthomonadales bacterium]|nr:hypothetical protein [Xanthomonadales bacterium]
MDKSEIARWNTAAELLHEILELPPEQRQEAIDSLGKQHGVAHELALLHSGNEATSLLDGTLG